MNNNNLINLPNNNAVQYDIVNNDYNFTFKNNNEIEMQEKPKGWLRCCFPRQQLGGLIDKVQAAFTSIEQSSQKLGSVNLEILGEFTHLIEEKIERDARLHRFKPAINRIFLQSGQLLKKLRMNQDVLKNQIFGNSNLFVKILQYSTGENALSTNRQFAVVPQQPILACSLKGLSHRIEQLLDQNRFTQNNLINLVGEKHTHMVTQLAFPARNYRRCSSRELLLIMTVFPFLRALVVRCLDLGGLNCTPQEFLRIIELCASVESLQFPTSITDAHLSQLTPEHLPKIRDSNFADCVHITDQGINSISDAILRRLDSINFTGCNQLTRQSIQRIYTINDHIGIAGG